MLIADATCALTRRPAIISQPTEKSKHSILAWMGILIQSWAHIVCDLKVLLAQSLYELLTQYCVQLTVIQSRMTHVHTNKKAPYITNVQCNSSSSGGASGLLYIMGSNSDFGCFKGVSYVALVAV